MGSDMKEIVMAYIDDALTFCENLDKFATNTEKVLKHFIDAQLKLKPSKCLFGSDTVEYFEYTISSKGRRQSVKKIATILEMQPPTTAKALHSFICRMHYYRTLIENFAELVAPLQELVIERGKLVWREDKLRAFNHLKQTLCTGPIMVHPPAL